MTQNKPIIYSFRRCPFAIRARLAIMAADQKVELRNILLKEKPAHMLEISPKGTVPVLQLPDGTVIDESLDIIFWALGQNDPENWLRCKDTCLKLIAQNDGSFKYALDRYKYITRYPDEADTDWRTEGEKFLKLLEQKLTENAFLCGDTPTLADYAIFPFIRQFRMPDKKWFDEQAPYPKLRIWLATFTEGHRFKSAMKKQPLWEPGTKGLPFP